MRCIGYFSGIKVKENDRFAISYMINVLGQPLEFIVDQKCHLISFSIQDQDYV